MGLNELSADVEHVSQVYAEKFGITRDASWFLLKLQEEVGELTQAFLMMTGQARQKGKSAEERAEDFRLELADVFSQVLLIARFHDIDLQAVVDEKWLVWTTALEVPIVEKDPVAEVLVLERELQTAECRSNSARVQELLADDFTEVGASGRRWHRQSILDLLANESGAAIEVHGLTGRIIDDGHILTDWESRRGDNRAQRSSLWRLTSARWQLVHHQGTPIHRRDWTISNA
nr:DUF4440 domain-containing protein [Rhodococcus sp. (in: high G+C Gram-positive bacteria)]